MVVFKQATDFWEGRILKMKICEETFYGLRVGQHSRYFVPFLLKNLFNKFINNKTGKNLLLEHNIPDNVYASFDDEELADFKKKKK